MTVQASERLEGLDVFRGLAVAAMILVNNPGSDQIWWPLDHAAWHGWTPTDLIFPCFLFAVGVALGLGFPHTLGPAERRTVWKRIAWRSTALILLGLGFSILARLSIENLRYFGVLQRIGLCYGLGAAFVLLTARRVPDGRFSINGPVMVAGLIGCLALYWALLMLITVPGHGAGQLSPEGNLAGYIDRTLFEGHIWRHGKDAAGNVVYDPEGLLSTLGAFANVLIGILVATYWKRGVSGRIWHIAAAGVAFTLLGLVLHPFLPINKRIWTSSFAIFTSGASMLILVLCVITVSRPLGHKLAAPLRVFGMNAILGYCLSLLIGIAGLHAFIPDGAGGLLKMPQWGFNALNAMIGQPYIASAAYGFAVLFVTLALLIPLHKRGIFWRL